jgi:uncharacterized protein with PIN domain
MAKEVLDAVFFKDGKKPKCPECLYNLKPITKDYGVENNEMFFISECDQCDKRVKYFTDGDHYPIVKKIVERKIKK